MQNLILFLALILPLVADATAELPFTKYYGRYQVSKCKKIEATNSPTDWCLTKEILIERAAACRGAPHTQMSFASAGQQFNSTCTSVANVIYPHTMTFGPGTDLNPEFYRYGKDEDGSDHFYIRSIADKKTYVYEDFWLKKGPDQDFTAKFKRRETSLDSPDVNLNSHEYEIVMKRVEP